MAFAALGAADVLTDDPDHRPARALLVDAVSVIGLLPPGSWRWPEPRLAYANAALAEALIAAGAALANSAALDRGLTMLNWLLELETPAGHLSPTGVGGRGPGDSFRCRQSAIEAAALADACWRAYTVTVDRTWVTASRSRRTGYRRQRHRPEMYTTCRAGFDGLQPEGVNVNQGAESTLALISTMQRARSFAPAP